ncbi:MAG TPA: signal peptidase I [Cryptosporangiaceae bacterium]|nr:signal peptidase I [Cryptosporangiaceae bacterium]
MRPDTEKRKQRSIWIELPVLALVAILVAVGVRTFLVQTFFIPSGSMENTLLVDDRVLVNKVVYSLRDPERGEIVVFVPPPGWNAGSGKEDYIKRVIGVGGDRVVCCDAQNRVTVNGRALVEEYLFPGDAPSSQPFDVTVPTRRLFLLGDHRSASADSRFHLDADLGTVPVDLVVGRAFVIFWPPGRMGGLSIPDTFSQVPVPAGG